MKKLLFFLIPLFFSTAQAQNLVPNESFENVKALPCSWIVNDFGLYMNDWIMPTAGSSDIFNRHLDRDCYASCNSTNPEANGKQLPRTGDNMCGIYCYGAGATTNYREYLEIKLKSPMVPGKTYYAEMYVSFAEYSKFACNNIGMYFSPTEVSASIFDPLPFTPQVKATDIVSDSVNWVKISGTFEASQAMNYLIIGNFNDNQHTAKVVNPRAASFYMNAYYFIDDVFVKADTTNNTSYCETIFIPNLITPNGDGLNDLFTIGCLGNGGWQLEVYDAWGGLVYYSTDYRNNWEANGISSGVYYYKVSKTNKPSYNGWLHILRE